MSQIVILAGILAACASLGLPRTAAVPAPDSAPPTRAVALFTSTWPSAPRATGDPRVTRLTRAAVNPDALTVLASDPALFIPKHSFSLFPETEGRIELTGRHSLAPGTTWHEGRLVSK